MMTVKGFDIIKKHCGYLYSNNCIPSLCDNGEGCYRSFLHDVPIKLLKGKILIDETSLRLQIGRKDFHRREADAYGLRSNREREIARLFMIAGEHEMLKIILGDKE